MCAQSLGIAAEMHLYPEAYVIAILDSSSEVTEAKYFRREPLDPRHVPCCGSEGLPLLHDSGRIV